LSQLCKSNENVYQYHEKLVSYKNNLK
jgi:hypothetical protein